MTPTYDHDGIRLFHGDAVELLRGTGPGRPIVRPRDVAVVVMDPPYGVEYVSGYLDPRKSRCAIAGDRDLWFRDFLLRWADGHAVACFNSWRRPAPAGARGRLVWDKGPCAGMGDLDLPWKGSAEDLFILGPGWRGRRDEGVLRVPSVHAGSVGRNHPTEKPVALLFEVLKKAPPGLVLDPCCGSGATLLAARELGRPAIGIEVDERWVRVAVERLRQKSFAFQGGSS